MDARTFRDAFVQKTTAICQSMPRQETIRTGRIYSALGDIGKEAGFIVRCKESLFQGGKEEFMDLDITYFDEKCFFTPHETKKRIRGCPRVIIEHENQTDIHAACRDFRKICLFAVPLRVFIGYARTSSDAQAGGKVLIESFKRLGLQQLSNGQTLLIMGSLGSCSWVVWLKEGTNEWCPF